MVRGIKKCWRAGNWVNMINRGEGNDWRIVGKSALRINDLCRHGGCQPLIRSSTIGACTASTIIDLLHPESPLLFARLLCLGKVIRTLHSNLIRKLLLLINRWQFLLFRNSFKWGDRVRKYGRDSWRLSCSESVLNFQPRFRQFLLD